MDYFKDLQVILPEVILTGGVLVTLVMDLVWKGKGSWRVGAIACVVLLFAGWMSLDHFGVDGQTVFGMVTVDSFGAFFKIFTSASLIVVIFFSLGSREIRRDGTGEFHFVLLSAALGVYFLVSTYNLLLLYLSLELLSLSSFVLAGYLKGSRRSGEAALKYVVFGALASGIMVYGLSLIFGLTGTLDIRDLGAGLADGSINEVAAAVAILLSLAGFAYKISAVPFHFWTPDVYEGAPLPVTTFLAVASKAAGFGVFLRFVWAGTGMEQNSWGFAGDLGHLLAFMAAVTMTLGNLAALRQQNLKRMLAYSSIAHAGYILVGMAAMVAVGGAVRHTALEASIFYLIAYYFMNLGAFGCLIYYANSTGNETLDSLRGLGWKSPVASACMVIFLISLTGLPPTVGFFGKYYLFVAAVDAELMWLAMFLALNSVVSLFYYFRVARALYLVDPSEAKYSIKPSMPMSTLLLLFGGATILFGLFATPIKEICAQSIARVFS